MQNTLCTKKDWMNFRNILTVGSFVSIAALTACGGGGTAGVANGGVGYPIPTPVQNPPPTTDHSLPHPAMVDNKKVWVTSGGLASYIFNGDGTGVSNCTGTCASVWPPLMAGANSHAVGDFTIISRKNPSGSQWAYLGHPLYTFSADTPGKAPGGNNVNGFSFALVAGQTGGPTPPPRCTGRYC
jgi:predicted lipoprotein with Yx(FWY)xxD motif